MSCSLCGTFKSFQISISEYFLANSMEYSSAGHMMVVN